MNKHKIAKTESEQKEQELALGGNYSESVNKKRISRSLSDLGRSLDRPRATQESLEINEKHSGASNSN